MDALKLSRTAYFRPTVGHKCDHKDTWTGEDDLLLNIKGMVLKLTSFMCFYANFTIHAK